MNAVVKGEGLDNSRSLQLWLDSDSGQIERLTANVYEAIDGAGSIRQKRSLAYGHLKLVLLNLLAINAGDETRYCAYSRTRNTYAAKSRYNPLQTSPGLIEVVDALAGAGMIEHHPGFFNRENGSGRVSRMRATGQLLAMIDFEPEDLPALLKCPASMESIKLYGSKVGGKRGLPIEYADTNETRRMRDVLTAYNDLLQRTDIRLDMDPADVRLLGHDADEWAFNPASKRLYRVFNDGRWDHGGRFYGGWWESISDFMRARITINGRRTIELDYSAFHITMLYALRGIDYRREIGEDPYRLDGWECSPRMRAVLKQAILIAVNARNYKAGLKALTSKLAHNKAEYGWVFEDKGLLDRLLRAMIDKHETIAGDLFSGRGICLQYLDSQITERLLIGATDREIVLLPIHDSYIVDERLREYLDHEMDRCFWEVIDTNRARDIREENLERAEIESIQA